MNHSVVDMNLLQWMFFAAATVCAAIAFKRARDVRARGFWWTIVMALVFLWAMYAAGGK